MTAKWHFLSLVFMMITLGGLLLMPQPGVTQDSDASCPIVVKQALADVGNNCGGLERNAACYGFNRVAATFNQEVGDDVFSRPADQAGLRLLQTIETAPLNSTLNEWGVAVMSVQANIPNTLPGQAVSFILLGDVSVENAVQPEQAVEPASDPISVTVLADANIRSQPTTNSNVVGSVISGSLLSADATNPEKDWVRVVFAQRTPGWIKRSLVDAQGELDALPVFERDSKTPMQAFYFRTGIGEPTCEQSPDVLVVQGPQNTTVDITANGANISISSTIALRTTANNQFQVITISGEAEVNGVIIPAGYTASFQVSEDGQTIEGLLDGPRPMTQEELASLEWLEGIPESILNYPIEVRDIPTSPPPSNSSVSDGVPPNAVDCRNFRATSPLDGLAYGMNTFYWDGAPGATGYRITVEGVGSADVSASETNVSFDISSAGHNAQMTWTVQALYNDVIACSSQMITIPREWAPAPVVPAPPPFYATWICSEASFYVDYSGLPTGTTSVSLNFVMTGASPNTIPPVLASVPPDSGTWSIFANATFFSLSGGSVTANPSGASVLLPDLNCVY